MALSGSMLSFYTTLKYTHMQNRVMAKAKKRNWSKLVLIIVGFVLLAMFFASCVGIFIETPQFGNVAVIAIHGPITVMPPGGFGAGGASSEQIVELIQDAEEDATIKAVLFDINSPGGSAVASDEIGQAIKNLSKPTVAVIREIGASGGYWVASAADHVIANRMTITGSIGVISSYLEFADFITRYDVKYRRLVAGKYKDMGTPFKELSEEEQAIFQQLLDNIRAEFVREVAANRDLSYTEVDYLATGQIYLGKEAKSLGLIDELGGTKEAVEYLEAELDASIDLVTFEADRSFFELLAGTFGGQSYSVGQGIGDALMTEASPALPELR